MGKRITPQLVKRFALSDALDEAITARCEESGVEFSTWLRGLAADAIGKPELAILPKGRPVRKGSEEAHA